MLDLCVIYACNVFLKDLISRSRLAKDLTPLKVKSETWRDPNSTQPNLLSAFSVPGEEKNIFIFLTVYKTNFLYIFPYYIHPFLN